MRELLKHAFFAVAMLFAIAIGSGVARASYEEGMRALDGWDYETAIKHFERANDAASLRKLGEIFSTPNASMADPRKSLQYLSEAVDKGNREALRDRSTLVLSGRVPIDPGAALPVAEALSTLMDLCEKGDYIGCDSAGLCLDPEYRPCRRLGIPVDAAKRSVLAGRARSAAKLAAASGDVRAMRYLLFRSHPSELDSEENSAYEMFRWLRNEHASHVDMEALRKDPSRLARLWALVESLEQASGARPLVPASRDLDRLLERSLPGYLRATNRDIRTALYEHGLMWLVHKTNLDPERAERALQAGVEDFSPRLRAAIQEVRAAPLSDGLAAEPLLRRELEARFSSKGAAAWVRAHSTITEAEERLEAVLDASERRIPQVLWSIKRLPEREQKARLTRLYDKKSERDAATAERSWTRYANDTRLEFLTKDYLGLHIARAPYDKYWLRVERPIASLRRALDREEAVETIVLMGISEQEIYGALPRSAVLAMQAFKEGALERERAKTAMRISSLLEEAPSFRGIRKLVDEFEAHLAKGIAH